MGFESLLPPVSTFPLRDPFSGTVTQAKFTLDHTALYLLHEHTQCEDPIDYLAHGFFSKGPSGKLSPSTPFIWEVAWALSYPYREQYGDRMTWVKFLSSLPMSDGYQDFLLMLFKLFQDALPKPKKKLDQQETSDPQDRSPGVNDITTLGQ